MSTESPLEELAESIDRSPDEIEAVFADVNRVLESLIGMDIDVSDPDDLERVRQQLPTEPLRAELLSAALPPALDAAFEYVHGSDRQSAYWRRPPERSNPEALSEAELRHRIAFTETMIDARGTEGTTQTPDGRRIARSAERLKDSLDGQTFTDPDDLNTTEQRRGRSILRRIKAVVGR